MPTDAEHVCLSGKTGADRPAVKATRMTHFGSRRPAKYFFISASQGLGRLGSSGLEGGRPPQQVVDHPLSRVIATGKRRLDVAAPEIRHERLARPMHAVADRRHL